MKRPVCVAHICVMTDEESRRWHAPVRPLREAFQDQMVKRVEQSAARAGRVRAYLFDAEERLQWRAG